MGTVFYTVRKRAGSPPPSRLDVTVRTWHHWLPVLRWVVAPDGERPEGTMPAFCANPGGLGIDAETAWVQSLGRRQFAYAGISETVTAAD